MHTNNAHTEETKQLLSDLAAQFIDGAFKRGVPHLQLLEALLTAYVAVAETHTCCTGPAGGALQRCADRLKRAAEHGPAAAHIH